MSGQSPAQNELQKLLGIASVEPGMVPLLLAALERARVVGVLDAWARECAGEWRMVSSNNPTQELPWFVALHDRDGNAISYHDGLTTDTARAAAAKAIEAGEV